MPVRPNPTHLATVLVAALLVAGCGDEPAEQAGSAADPNAFTAASATTVLADFDKADASASAAGDLVTLAKLEASPALDASTAAVRKAQFFKRNQPTFRHVEPGFAVGAKDAPCFLVGATLQVSGGEIGQHDVSQFVRDGAGWKLSHNVLVAQDVLPVAMSLAGKPAVTPTYTLDEARRRTIAAEVFARTTATGPPDESLVAGSAVLDKQLAAGWGIYQQQMKAANYAVTRRLTGSEWSTCGADVGGATIAFLTLYATDTVSGTAGNRVMLPAEAPDVAGTGHKEPVQGATVSVQRVEVFLLHVPAKDGAAGVLGLSDAPIAVTAAEQ